MGNLLRVLYNRDDGSCKVDIFVDFENAQPTHDEIEVWSQVEPVLRIANSILYELQQYNGAQDDIRNAISNPSNEGYQRKAWDAVCPLVDRLTKYFEFSIALETIVPQLLRKLCSNEMTPKQHLETQQALFKLFAKIIDFALKFDDLKMRNPAIQNDFTYYRRSFDRMRDASDEKEFANRLDVHSNTADRMAIFYANATPMLKILSDTTSRFVSENKELPVENTTDCLSTMANICRVMIENPRYRSRFSSEETEMFCLRVMVGVIILFDHVHPMGAFVKASNIDVKNSIKVLKDQEDGKVEGLLNALRYTTKHLKDETTPKAIRSMLQV